MPLFQYFGWVGSFLLAAMLAANWCISSPMSSPDIPLDQKINIRIRTDHKWPERVVFDTTASALAPKTETESSSGKSEPPVLKEGQPFDAFAEMAANPVKPCFLPPCSAKPAPERDDSPIEKGSPSPSRSRVAARKISLPPIGFTSRQEEADTVTHESRQLAAQLLCALSHKRPHQHRQENEIHEYLRCGQTSFRAERPL